MTRRKQAKPIRVLENEDGAVGDLPALDLTNGGASSDAESATGSPSESEDEDANESKMLESQSDVLKSDCADADFEDVKPNFVVDGYPKLVDITKRLSCSDVSTIKQEFDDDDQDNEDEEPLMAEGVKIEDDEDESVVPGNEVWDNRNYHKRLKLRHRHTVDGVREKANSVAGMNALVDQLKVGLTKPEEENDDNNNSNADGHYEDRDTDHEDRCTPTPEELQMLPPAYAPQLPPSHVTFEALQNTRVAVRQHTALSHCPSDPGKLQELAAYLHQQYILQMKVIQQRLQEQIETSKPPSSPERPPSIEEPSAATTSTLHSNVPISLVVNRPSSPSSLSILTPPKPSRTPTPIKREPSSPPPASQPLPSSTASHQKLSSPPLLCQQQPVPLPPCSISSSFASSIITNLDPPPSPSEPNSLEILTKHTQEILDNASQGLLANNLADELAFRKGVNGKGSSLSPYDSKSGGRNEPFFKHRCRYCGKVFGSDSALQIHIRSHTGERPFKCNVCGSRFTTKGNLKVHFQRHTSKFPHIKMNPHPVPEHLDKFHPPLLAQMGSSQHQTLPPGMPTSHAAVAAAVANIPISSPGHPQPAFPVATTFPPTSLSHLYRSTATHPSHPLSLPTPPPRLPQDSLFRPLSSYSLFGSHMNNSIDQDQPENLCKPTASTAAGNSSSNQSNHSSPTPFENGDQFKDDSGDDEVMQAMSETSEVHELAVNDEGHDESDEAQRHRSRQSPTEMDSGSGDDASLQEQPENLSNKMRGNTTCNLCYKTFACNSALEIHYRSHTKERPYKCAVCDRGFSTKVCLHLLQGNMKQHMLTHKIRDLPPHLFEKKSPGSVSVPSSLVDETSNASSESREPLPSAAASTAASSVHSVSALESLSSAAAVAAAAASTAALSKSAAAVPNLGSLAISISEPSAATPSTVAAVPPPRKRSPDTNAASQPVPKRQPNLLKHLCPVCNKNFSSSSALQIHMRTHTGDKPFQCTVCLKAFTTKGNLKVHMGTHMYPNGTARRGRRMSLEIPTLPISGKEQGAEFYRQPNLFLPYLPSHFYNAKFEF